MKPLRSLGSKFIIAVTLVGCASTHNTEVRSKPVFESAYVDQNQAPKKLSPPEDINSKDNLNPYYLQAQADYNYSVGESLGYEGNSAAAIESFKTALIYDQKSPRLRLRLAAEYIKLGYLSEGIEQLQEAVKLKPDYTDAHMLLAGVYSSMKAFDKAFAEYNLVLKYDKNNSEAPLYLGALYAEKKEFAKAIVQFESLLKNDEADQKYLIYFYLGKVWLEKNEKNSQAKALEAFENALKNKPDFVEAVIAIGSIYNAKKQYANSFNRYKEYEFKYGKNTKIAEIVSAIYLEQQNYDAAFDELEYLEANQEDVLNTKMKLSLILIEQKKYEQAVKKLNELLVMVPESDKIRFYLGAVYEELKQSENAASHYEKIPVESQFYTEAIVHASYLYKQEKKYSAAEKLLKKAIENNGDSPQMFSLYATILDEQKEYDKAIELLKSAAFKYPKSAQVHFFLGSIYDKKGNKEKVIENMRKVLEIEPNHVQGLNYLAYTYADTNTSLSEAEKLARKALGFEPADGFVMDTLGWILFKQGKNAEAIVVLEKASIQQPGESIIAEHLGDAYKKQKLVQKAKQMYLRAVEYENDESKQELLRAKILAIDDKTNIAVDRVPASVPAQQINSPSER